MIKRSEPVNKVDRNGKQGDRPSLVEQRDNDIDIRKDGKDAKKDLQGDCGHEPLQAPEQVRLVIVFSYD